MAEKKKKRRNSQLFGDLQLNENVNLEENEQLRDLYLNKNYVPPEIKKFETIFETARRGLTEDGGGLFLGKSQGKRFVEPYKFWRSDDKEKNRKRKQMIAKQFKGRKRKKFAPLDENKEHELQVLIDEKEDTILESDDEETGADDRDKIEDIVVVEIEQKMEQAVLDSSQESEWSLPDDMNGCVWNLPDKSSSKSNFSVLSSEEFGECVWNNAGDPDEISAPIAVADTIHGSCNNRDKNELPSSTHSIKTVPETTFSLPAAHSSNKSSATEPPPNSLRSIISSTDYEAVDIASDFLSSSACSSVFEACATEVSKEELLELINSEDLLFCGPSTTAKDGKKRRESTRRSVRRSARFLQPGSKGPSTGSYFAVEDIEVNSRRKKKPVAISLDMEEGEYSSQEEEIVRREDVETSKLDGVLTMSSSEDKNDRDGDISDNGNDDCAQVGSDQSSLNREDSREKTSLKDYVGKTSDVSCDETRVQVQHAVGTSENHNIEAIFNEENRKGEDMEFHEADIGGEINDASVTDLEGEGSSRRSSFYKDLSTSLGGSSQVDIPLPESVRRSFTGEFVPRPNRSFNLSDGGTAVNSQASSSKSVPDCGSPVTSDGIQSARSIPSAFDDSESEEEEIISGMLGTKLMSQKRSNLKERINRGFLAAK